MSIPYIPCNTHMAHLHHCVPRLHWTLPHMQAWLSRNGKTQALILHKPQSLFKSHCFEPNNSELHFLKIKDTQERLIEHLCVPFFIAPFFLELRSLSTSNIAQQLMKVPQWQYSWTQIISWPVCVTQLRMSSLCPIFWQ